VNDDDIKASLCLAAKWSRDELDAYINASNWLFAAANGLTPHGDVSCPESNAKVVVSTSNQVMTPTTATTIPCGTSTVSVTPTIPATEMPLWPTNPTEMEPHDLP
jgi:hypothetical protein